MYIEKTVMHRHCFVLEHQKHPSNLPKHFLILTDLFQQAIQMSGSFLCPWTLNDRVVETSMNTAKSLGCPRGNVDQKECLKRLELDELVEGIQQSVGTVIEANLFSLL